MNFNDISVGQIITFITSTGIIAGFSYKVFSLFNQVKINKENIKQINNKIEFIENDRKIEKDQLIAKVEETNNAVNLLCSAVSALIADSLLDNEESKNRLKEIKRKLDSEKEIIWMTSI